MYFLFWNLEMDSVQKNLQSEFLITGPLLLQSFPKCRKNDFFSQIFIKIEISQQWDQLSKIQTVNFFIFIQATLSPKTIIKTDS